MLISMLVSRTPSQQLRAVLRFWTVTGGTQDMVTVQFDPHGPLTASEAARLAMHALLRELGRRNAGDADGAGRGWVDVPLWDEEA